MFIQSVKRWHWMAISLIVGGALGYANRMPTANWSKAFGDTIIQEHFEKGLVREQAGRRWFRNIVVYPETIEAGGRLTPIHIVCGEYYNGKPEMRNGQLSAVWKPRCYIAQIPYEPFTTSPLPGPKPTVLTYLDSEKVNYTYAWWRDPRWGMSIWLAGSFALIGIVWPTVINLLTFGSSFRPREEKGTDLSHVRADASAGPIKPGVTATDTAQVAEMGKNLEMALAAELSDSTPATQVARQPKTVVELAATKLELTADEQARENKEFGKDRDDFYPTERHTHPHKL